LGLAKKNAISGKGEGKRGTIFLTQGTIRKRGTQKKPLEGFALLNKK